MTTGYTRQVKERVGNLKHQQTNRFSLITLNINMWSSIITAVNIFTKILFLLQL